MTWGGGREIDHTEFEARPKLFEKHGLFAKVIVASLLSILGRMALGKQFILNSGNGWRWYMMLVVMLIGARVPIVLYYNVRTKCNQEWKEKGERSTCKQGKGEERVRAPI